MRASFCLFVIVLHLAMHSHKKGSMSAEDENSITQGQSITSTRGKEGEDSIHVEVASALSNDDRAFLDNFTDEQRRKVIWKVSYQSSSHHPTQYPRLIALVVGYQTCPYASLPLPHSLPRPSQHR